MMEAFSFEAVPDMAAAERRQRVLDERLLESKMKDDFNRLIDRST